MNTEKAGPCEGAGYKYRKQTREDRVPRNTRTGGLAHLTATLSPSQGKGGKKGPGRQSP